MASGQLATVRPSLYGNSPLRGVVFANVPEEERNPQGYLSIITGASTSDAIWLSNLNSAPAFNETDERTNPFEPLYGKTAAAVGEDVVLSAMHEITVEMTALTLQNIRLMRPDMKFELKMSNDATPVAIGVKMTRTLESGPDTHLDNIVIAYSTSTHTIGRDVVLYNPKATTEERSYELSDDLEVFGVETTFQAFATDANLDPVSGVLLPAFEENDYTVTSIPAGLV